MDGSRMDGWITDGWMVKYLDVSAVGMVALAALGARHEPTLLIHTKGSAHDAGVLLQHETILRRAEHQPVLQDRLPFDSGCRSVRSFAEACRNMKPVGRVVLPSVNNTQQQLQFNRFSHKQSFVSSSGMCGYGKDLILN